MLCDSSCSSAWGSCILKNVYQKVTGDSPSPTHSPAAPDSLSLSMACHSDAKLQESMAKVPLHCVARFSSSDMTLSNIYCIQ